MATEKRLIDANALMKAIRSFRWIGPPNTIKLMFEYLWLIIRDQPTVDAVEVVHGVWDVIEDDYAMETFYRCSVCKEDFVTIDESPEENLWNYCPNCGADMRERKDND